MGQTAHFPISISTGCALTWRHGGTTWMIPTARLTRETIRGTIRENMRRTSVAALLRPFRRFRRENQALRLGSDRTSSDRAKTTGPERLRLLKSLSCEVQSFIATQDAATDTTKHRARVRSAPRLASPVRWHPRRRAGRHRARVRFAEFHSWSGGRGARA